MQLRVIRNNKETRNIKTLVWLHILLCLLICKLQEIQCNIDKQYHSCMIKNTALILVANGILRYLFFQKIFGQIYVRAVIYQILYFTMRNKKWSNWKQSRIVKFLLMHFRTGRYVELIFQCMFLFKKCA